MTSERKVIANRINSARSTGPKSIPGKRTASQNAYRHGLAMPVDGVPELVQQADRLAHVIVDQMGGPDCFSLARRIAEADMDIRRVRAARAATVNLISVARSARWLPPKALDDEKVDKFLTEEGSAVLVWAEYRLPCPGAEEGIARAAVQTVPQLARLDRYERRALSRRRRAIWMLLAEIDRNRAHNASG